MKKKNLIKLVPALAITLLVLTMGGFDAVALASDGTVTSSLAQGGHNMRGILGVQVTRGRSRGIVGQVTTINGTSLTIKSSAGTLYSVDASGARIFKDFASSTIAIAEVKIGDSIMVRGTIVDQAIKATVIFDGKFAGPGNAKNENRGEEARMMRGVKGFGIRGVVTTVSGSTFSIDAKNNKTYSVDATNAVIFRGTTKATSTIADIKSGDVVMVQGTTTGTTIIASKVIDGLSNIEKKIGHK
jgi:hypothetical protein